MRIIPIYIRDVKPNARYMLSPDGRADLLGQILISGFNLNVSERSKTPAELKKIIPPFTMQCRGTIMNTPLTMELLVNTKLTSGLQIEKANILLAPHNIKLEKKIE